jgi:serine/threonine-protein kinase
VVWLDGAGKKTPLIAGAALLTPRVSPDGKLVAMSANRDISVYDPQRGSSTRITFTSASNTNPVWTPDGKHIVYAAVDGIWWTRADGSAQPVRILETATTIGGGAKGPGSFSPDGRRLALFQTGEKTGADIWILPLDIADLDHPKPGKPELFVQTPLQDVDPAFSPDGRWLAYTSAEAGSLQVYVRPYPAGTSGGKWQITTTTPGHFPTWSKNGKQLFYATTDGRIMVVEYTAKGETFSPGKPREWGNARIATTGPYSSLDLAPDGKRFVVIPLPDMGGEKASVHAVFLVNFFDDLKRRMP